MGVLLSLQAEPTVLDRPSGRAALVFKLLIELIELLQFARVNPPLAHRGRPKPCRRFGFAGHPSSVFHNKGEMETVVAPGPLRVSL